MRAMLEALDYSLSSFVRKTVARVFSAVGECGILQPEELEAGPGRCLWLV